MCEDHYPLISLSESGNAVKVQLHTLEFLAMNRGYFEEHSLRYLPLQFAQRIGTLQDCEIIHGTVRTLAKFAKMYERGEYVKALIAQVPLDHIGKIAHRAREGMQVSYIFGENTIVPEGRREELAKEGWIW